MKNINLKNRDKVQKNLKGSSLIPNLGVIILLLSFSIYGVLFFLDYSTKKKSQEVKDQISEVERGLGSEEFNEMFSFNIGLIDLKSRIPKEGLSPQTSNIIDISKNTLPSVRFLTFDSEDNDNYSLYEIEMIVPDYATLVKQIRAYKEMENVKNFFLVSAEDKEGLLKADLNFEIGEKTQSFDSENISGDNF